mmetsp:Transcript_22526/g.62493  ORF Transcript_22526/g.62493 Transcript_22526/m.62493 type:complete len:217 (+) Transcript_22526:1708-2358(+)
MLVRVLHMHHKPKGHQQLALRAHHLVPHQVVLLGVQLQELRIFPVLATCYAVKDDQDLPHVGLQLWDLFQLGRQPEAGQCRHLDVKLPHGSLAVEAVEEHLPGGHHHLREAKAHTAGLDDLTSVNALHGLCLLVHTVLPRGRAILKGLIWEVEIVDFDKVCLGHRIQTTGSPATAPAWCRSRAWRPWRSGAEYGSRTLLQEPTCLGCCPGTGPVFA